MPSKREMLRWWRPARFADFFFSSFTNNLSHTYVSPHREYSFHFISLSLWTQQLGWIALNLTIWVLSARSRRARESNKREIVNDDGFLRLSGRIRQQVQTAQVRHFNRPRKNSLISWILILLRLVTHTEKSWREWSCWTMSMGIGEQRIVSVSYEHHYLSIIDTHKTFTSGPASAADSKREGGCSTFNFHAQNKHSRRSIVRFHLDEQKAAE